MKAIIFWFLKLIQWTTIKDCDMCEGSGIVYYRKREICPKCEGSGEEK